MKQTNLNMMFSLLLCLGVVWVADHVKHKGEKMLWLCVLVICSLWTDWALLAPVFTMLFANAYGDRKKVSLAYGKAVGLFFLLNVLSYRADCGLESALIHSACACIGPAASGVIGTAKAMELGEVEGAMSSLAIAVAGLLTVVGASVFAQFM